MSDAIRDKIVTTDKNELYRSYYVNCDIHDIKQAIML